MTLSPPTKADTGAHGSRAWSSRLEQGMLVLRAQGLATSLAAKPQSLPDSADARTWGLALSLQNLTWKLRGREDFGEWSLHRGQTNRIRAGMLAWRKRLQTWRSQEPRGGWRKVMVWLQIFCPEAWEEGDCTKKCIYKCFLTFTYNLRQNFRKNSRVFPTQRFPPLSPPQSSQVIPIPSLFMSWRPKSKSLWVAKKQESKQARSWELFSWLHKIPSNSDAAE